MDEEASNEDLIEATIRRVAASKAARLSDMPRDDSGPGLHLVSAHTDDEFDGTPATELAPVDEDRIAATLRRIEAEQAARAETGTAAPSYESDGDDDPTTDEVEPARFGATEAGVAVDEDRIAATLRRIEAEQAARAETAIVELPAPQDGEIAADDVGTGDDEIAPLAAAEALPAVDEDRITATLRRIEAEQAARAEAAIVEPPDQQNLEPVADDWATEDRENVPLAAAEVLPAVDEDRISATLRRIEAEQAVRATQPAPTPVVSEERVTRADEAISRGASWEQVARDLQRQLDATRIELLELSERVDALAGGVSANSPSAPTRFDARSRVQSDAAAGEWDDTPQLPRIPMGVPPRPAIIRDPSPLTATAAQLGYDDSGPEIAPPVAAKQPEASDAKRGFELLPRTYRITVEDKRRGVDLVPLHRALLGLDGVRDVSLLSYSNGTAIVAAESTGELSPDVLGKAVSHAMAREVKVEVHNEQTMVVKLAED